MARTMTENRELARYPLGWLAAIVVAVILAIAASTFANNAPAPNAPASKLMIGPNFAP